MTHHQLEAAYRLTSQGRAREAIELIKRLLAQQPNNPYLHGLLAHNLMSEGRIHAAEYEVGIALQQDPTVAELYITGARIQFYKKKVKQALLLCDEALALDHEDVTALLMKHQILKHQKKFDDAKACVDQAASIDPENIDIHIAYGDLALALGQDQKAYQFAARALSINAQSLSANILMGEVQLALGEVDEALYHARLAIMINPEDKEALTLLVNIKTRENWFFGLWWRFNHAVSSLSNLKGSSVLISAFLFFTLSAQVLEDTGYPTTGTALSMIWIALVVYTWVGIPHYYKVLNKELESFTFNSKY